MGTGMPSACWRRPDNWALTSLTCRKHGDPGKPSFLQQYTGFSAVGKKKRMGATRTMRSLFDNEGHDMP